MLGPVDARVDGVSARLAPQPRAVLAMLLLQAGQVVPSARLVDGLWGDDPPATAANILQGYVSQLRKALGRDLLETREPGYAIHVGRDALDLHRFERLATDGGRALENGQAPAAAERLREALALWSGDALADVAEGDVLRPAAARLDELRLVALERRIEADLACGRDAELVGELETLTAEHALRERFHALRMLALYRCGRQAEALEVYRAARARLVDQLGLEPGAALQELEQAILRHDASLDLDRAQPRTSEARGAHDPRRRPRHRRRRLARDAGRRRSCGMGIASSSSPPRSPIPPRSRPHPPGCGRTASASPSTASRCAPPRSPRSRPAPTSRGSLASRMPSCSSSTRPRGSWRTPAFSACSTRPRATSRCSSTAPLVRGPVLVPFGGADHDWCAVELGAWLARAHETELVLAGSASAVDGRDASRLLASASLAVQRALGVTCRAAARRAHAAVARRRRPEREPRRRRSHRPLAPRRRRSGPHGPRHVARPPHPAGSTRPPPRRAGARLGRDAVHLDRRRLS